MTTPEFSRRVSTADIIAGEKLKKTIGAKREECEALAKRYDVVSIKDVKATLTVAKLPSSHTYKVTGDFSAEVGQKCVVTLEPLKSEVTGDIEAFFTDQKPPVQISQEVEMPSEQEDPEYAPDGQIDLGELVAEHIALAINPYPRAEDAEFDEEVHNDKKPNPFAALKVLKDDG